MTKDLFCNLDKQLSRINSAVKNNEEIFESDVEEVENKVLETKMKRENEKELGTTDPVQIVKIARKQDFNNAKSEDKQLLDWAAKMFGEWGKNYGSKKQTYSFSYEELQNLDLKKSISQHDSYWVIDFVKAAIDTVREEHTGYRYKCGRCEKYSISNKQLKSKLTRILHLNEKDEFGNQMMKLIDDIMDWMVENYEKVDCLDSEADLKKELLGYDYERLKDLFEWSDDDMITYHVLHFVVKEKAEQIIKAVRLLLESGETPSSIGLKICDDWVEKISSEVKFPH